MPFTKEFINILILLLAPRCQTKQDHNLPSGPLDANCRWLLELLYKGKLAAYDVCTGAASLGTFAFDLGVADLALTHDAAIGGKAARLIDDISGMKEFVQSDLIHVEIPLNDVATKQRSSRKICFVVCQSI